MFGIDKQTAIILAVGTVVLSALLYFKTSRKAKIMQAVKRAKEELRLWKGRTETDPAMQDRLIEYWNSGGWTGVNKSNIKQHDNEYAWSSAFISYLYAGEIDEFPPSVSHSEYTLKARDRNKQGYTKFSAYDPEDVRLKVGDIVVKGRSFNGTLDQLYLGAKTHGDIVVDINGNTATLIGGNISNTVKSKTIQLNPNKTVKRSDAFAVISM